MGRVRGSRLGLWRATTLRLLLRRPLIAGDAKLIEGLRAGLLAIGLRVLFGRDAIVLLRIVGRSEQVGGGDARPRRGGDTTPADAAVGGAGIGGSHDPLPV